MGTVTYYLGLLVPIVLAGLCLVAVLWETQHLIDWCNNLYNLHGDGSAASYLRHHAYTYMSWVFGDNPFGWTLGE